MDEAAVIERIITSFSGVVTLASDGDTYLYHDRAGDETPDRRFPFATLVTGDRHDTFSDLGRPGVYRLNVGVGKQTFQTLFGDGSGDHDFTALDRITPHPVYGKMYWVCILCPSEATFRDKVMPLLAEGHAMAARRHGGTQADGGDA